MISCTCYFVATIKKTVILCQQKVEHLQRLGEVMLVWRISTSHTGNRSCARKSVRLYWHVKAAGYNPLENFFKK